MKPALNKSLEFKYTAKRVRRRREPLRTTREFADELGLTLNQLYGYLNLPGAPSPFIRGTCSGSYFRPSEFYKWWNSLDINR